jgi:two-component system LytT family response regulator
VVVLCTAYGDHALAAFEQGVVDYLMKPVEAGRLKKAVDRAREQLSRVRGAPLARLAIPTRQGIVLLDPATVSHAVLEGELITIATAQGDFLCDDTLAELHARLPAGRFERVHRKALVNLEHVVRLEPTPSGGFLAKMRGGQSVEVSRQSARDLRKRLGLR